MTIQNGKHKTIIIRTETREMLRRARVGDEPFNSVISRLLNHVRKQLDTRTVDK